MESTVKGLMNNVAEIELVYRSHIKESERPVVRNSVEAYEIYMGVWNKDAIELLEEFKVMFLNQGKRY